MTSIQEKRNPLVKNFRTWFPINTTKLFRAAVNKLIMTNMVANIWTEQEPKGEKYDQVKGDKNIIMFENGTDLKHGDFDQLLSFYCGESYWAKLF